MKNLELIWSLSNEFILMKYILEIDCAHENGNSIVETKVSSSS